MFKLQFIFTFSLLLTFLKSNSCLSISGLSLEKAEKEVDSSKQSKPFSKTYYDSADHEETDNSRVVHLSFGDPSLGDIVSLVSLASPTELISKQGDGKNVLGNALLSDLSVYGDEESRAELETNLKKNILSKLMKLTLGLSSNNEFGLPAITGVDKTENSLTKNDLYVENDKEGNVLSDEESSPWKNALLNQIIQSPGVTILEETNSKNVQDRVSKRFSIPGIFNARTKSSNVCLDDRLGFPTLQWICGPYSSGDFGKFMVGELCVEDKEVMLDNFSKMEDCSNVLEKCCRSGDPFRCGSDPTKRKQLIMAKFVIENFGEV